MARPKNHIPKYCLHTATGIGYARLQGGKGPPTYFRGPYGSRESRKAYDDALVEWLKNNRQAAAASEPEAVGPTPATATVSELVNRFWDYVLAHKKYIKYGRLTSERSNLRMAFRPLLKLFPDRRTATIGLLEMDELRLHMVTPKPNGMGWAERTVTGSEQRIRMLFDWGKEYKLVPEEVRLIRRKGLGKQSQTLGRVMPPRQPPDPAAVEAVKHAAGPNLRAMIELQQLNGIRSRGICYLRPCDIDQAADPEGELWLYVEPVEFAAKTGRERHWLGTRAQTVLKPFLKAAKSPTDRVFKTDERLGANITGGWRVEYFRFCIAKLCKRLGVKHWFPHQLRHSHATAIEIQFGREAAQARLCHTRPTTTGTYTKQSLTELAKMIARKVG
jgi:integrase